MPTGPEDAPMVFVGEAPGKFEVIRGQAFCFEQTTLVLDASLTWRPIDSFMVGDRIIAFDEMPPRVVQRNGLGVTPYGERRLKIAEILAVHRRRAECVRVEFENGFLVGTPDHLVLNAANGAGLPRRWRELGTLQCGSNRKSHVLSLGTWARNTSWESGWLAGFFDGEGHVMGSKSTYMKGRGYVGFSQNLGPTYDRAVKLLIDAGFDLRRADQQRTKGVVCGRVLLAGGLPSSMRFLGSVRPDRLISNFLDVLANRGGIGMKSLARIGAVRREAAGVHDVVDLTTTAGTFFANGYAVHNCGPSGIKLDEILYRNGMRRAEVRVTNALLCLRGATRVRMADGSQRRIVDLVTNRVRDDVLAVNERGELVNAPITGWYRSELGARRFVKVSSLHAKGNPRGTVGSIMTDDHLVLTQNGWVAAGQLTLQHRIATGHQALTGRGLELVNGLMLGDGGIPREQVGRSHSLAFAHMEKNRDYVEAKSRILSLFGVFKNKVSTPTGVRLDVRAKASPWFSEIGRAWYGAGKERRVPRDFRWSAFSLAIAFFDNGYMRHGTARQSAGEIATNRFGEEDVRFLAVRLAEDLHINARVRYGSGWRLHFGVDDARRLSLLIAPYAVGSMLYKLLADHRGLWNPAQQEYTYGAVWPTTFWDTPLVEEYEDSRSKTVYCIDVDRYHNFATTNAIVHNCRPEVPGEIGKKRYDVKAYMAWLRKENIQRKRNKHELLESPFDCCWPRLRRELYAAERHAQRRGAPNGVVVQPMGNFALKRLTGAQGIMKYRGSVMAPSQDGDVSK